MRTVKDILQIKGHHIWTTGPEATVFEALELMAHSNVGALLVMEGDAVVGMISERDYARKVILLGRASRRTLVREIMTSEVYYVRTDQGVEEAMALMTNKRVRHLPVLEEDRLVGLISIGDVVQALIADKEFLIQQLEGYITGTR